MSHSKRNTSRPVFTSHERAVAKSNWASSSARLNRDSFLPFGCCGLCLGSARDPVACLGGDIFCRECALANILAQRKAIKRAEKANHYAEKEAAYAKTMEDEEDRQRTIRDFELTQAGLPADEKPRGAEVVEKDQRQEAGKLAAPVVVDKLPEDVTEHDATVVVHVSSKRKFDLDDDEVLRVMKGDKRKARKAIEEEKAAKPALPCFWTPSLTPDVQDSKLPPASRKEKTVPVCPSSSADDLHPILMQKLITVHFHDEEGPSSQEKRRICPSCLKMLSNASSPVMTERCGHVLCMNCAKMLISLAGKSAPVPEVPPMCFTCEAPIASSSSKRLTSSDQLPTGLVALRSQGTGFSARGSNQVTKCGTVFQC